MKERSEYGGVLSFQFWIVSFDPILLLSRTRKRREGILLLLTNVLGSIDSLSIHLDP
jgi:hypothetical protein